MIKISHYYIIISEWSIAFKRMLLDWREFLVSIFHSKLEGIYKHTNTELTITVAIDSMACLSQIEQVYVHVLTLIFELKVRVLYMPYCLIMENICAKLN